MSEKTTENEMSFLGHLEELRWRLVRSVIVILIIAVVLFYFTDPIVKLVYLNMSKTNFPTYQFFCFLSEKVISSHGPYGQSSKHSSSKIKELS